MRFTKMQGIGNDYVYVNLFEETVEDAPALARKLSRRRFGVGSDGLILIGPSDRADFRMHMYNADGSRGAMCGNGARCVGKYVHDKGLTEKTELTLETDAGIRALRLNLEGGRVSSVRVDMGEPGFAGGQELPVEIGGRTFAVTPVSMGNPHGVTFLQEPVERFDLGMYGPLMERHPAFPEGINAEFVNVLSRDRLRMRVWERGSGVTLACGTGACAVLAAACLRGLTQRKARVELDGGELTVEWDEATGHVFMTGPAAFVFDGETLEE